ncbi:hypothetical protein FEF34_40735 [Streptomyces marianii]|uniref:Uncharacterized protein n=1 Tax=Streptomyces marianii TaxID=1817406 RepID=A0A5R9DVN5_9ACTN|nr:hypothetical protein FEF34_40735 [Streptomyces marianii]
MKVPWRLVASPFYPDVALSVYVKVAALAARPEGCEAKAETLASYLGLSKASVERGLTALSKPAPDGVAELATRRRTRPGGKGTSAVRRTRPVSGAEAFVWVPVAAAEDLTPRQLRAYAVIAYAEKMRIALTETELAGYLRHHTGQRAGQPITADAAGAVVDEVEAARWMTVQRRAGAQGRHRYIAHDIASEAAGPTVVDVAPAPALEPTDEVSEAPVDSGAQASVSSVVDEGSGSGVGEGSLANRESLRTDSPDDEGALFSPAVGEVPVGEVWKTGSDVNARTDAGGLALRADGNSQPVPTESKSEMRSSSGGSARSSYTGPQLAMSARVYAVLEPVHLLLERVNNDFVVRKIAREVGRQLREGMDAERLQHRLTARFAGVMVSEIRDPGRWLLGVALPRWGCGHLDCESGTMWSTGRRCDVCADIVADKFTARQRAQRLEQGLCPEHGTRPSPAGVCTLCELDDAVRHPAPLPARQEPQGPPRGNCGECGARIFVTGPALEDGLCKPCRQEHADLAAVAPTEPAAPARSAGVLTCSGKDGDRPCARNALPTRKVCARHRAQEVAAEPA